MMGPPKFLNHSSERREHRHSVEMWLLLIRIYIMEGLVRSIINAYLATVRILSALELSLVTTAVVIQIATPAFTVREEGFGPSSPHVPN